MEEVWKDIKGYEGLYQVSNIGNVKSLYRIDEYYIHGVLYKRPRKEKMLAQQKNHGYKRVSLCKKAKQKWFFVHRLGAEAFLPNPNNLPQVNHKDENKENNFIWVNEDGSVDFEKSNLEWCTEDYNKNYGTMKKRLSVIHKNRKDLSKPVYCTELEQTFPSIKEASRQTNIKFASIQRCAAGKQMHTIKDGKTFTWKYV